MGVVCPQCGRELPPPELTAGRTNSCPWCRTPVAVQKSLFAGPPRTNAARAASTPANRPRLRWEALVHSNVLKWIPVVCLALSFLLMFFPWVGVYAGGRAILSQSGMGVAFNTVAKHFTAHQELEARLGEFFSFDPNLQPGVGWLTLLYLLTIVAGLLTAIGLLAAPLAPWPPARKASAWRAPAVAGLCLAALGLLAVQLTAGFPLENQVAARMASDDKELMKKADQAEGADRQARKEWVEIQSGIKESLVQRGVAVWLAVAFNLLAAGSALAEYWRARRARPVAPPTAAGQSSALALAPAPRAIGSTS
jgi:hypothetical protein